MSTSSDETTLEARIRRLEEETRVLRDIEEIKALKARYWIACDGNIVAGPNHDYDTIADALYTEDGSWESAGLSLPGIERPTRRAEGREGLREYFKSARDRNIFIMHFGMAPLINVDGDQATGHWHVIATMHTADGATWIGAVYEDTYRRTSGGWRIKDTMITSGFQTPYEEGWHKVKYASRPKA